MIARARTVNAMLDRIGRSEAIPKADLQCGDCVLVVTENSVYRICVLDGGRFSISGGWFDRQGLSPVTTSIAGCTWGGSAIKRDVVAVLGLRLEFGNRVVTSPIRGVRVIRGGDRLDLRFRPLDYRELYLLCYGSQEGGGDS